jgi:hypothetical protein
MTAVSMIAFASMLMSALKGEMRADIPSAIVLAIDFMVLCWFVGRLTPINDEFDRFRFLDSNKPRIRSSNEDFQRRGAPYFATSFAEASSYAAYFA